MNDINYFSTMLKNLLFVLSANESDIGKKVHIAFESQHSVTFLEKLIPNAKFNVGRDIMDTVCSFLTSDIFISSGSTFALVLAFAPRNKPIIFEELRKEKILDEIRRENKGFKQHHIFRADDAILLRRGQPLLQLEEVKDKVEAALKAAKTCV
jgi:hypothetical protein